MLHATEIPEMKVDIPKADEFIFDYPIIDPIISSDENNYIDEWIVF